MGPGIRSPIQRLVVGWSVLTYGRPTFVLSISACRIRKFFQHGHNNQTTCGYGRKATSQQIGNTSQSPTTFALWSQSRSKTSLKKPNIAWSDRKILPEAHSQATYHATRLRDARARENRTRISVTVSRGLG